MTRKSKLTIAALTDIVSRDALRTADLSKFVAWLDHYDHIVQDAREWHQITKGAAYSPGMQASAKRKLTKFQGEQKEMIAAYHATMSALRAASPGLRSTEGVK